MEENQERQKSEESKEIKENKEIEENKESKEIKDTEAEKTISENKQKNNPQNAEKTEIKDVEEADEPNKPEESNETNKPDSNEPKKVEKKKKSSSKKIITTIVTIAVIIALIIIFSKGNLFAKTTETEMLNITYIIQEGNNTIDSGTNIFAKDTIASGLNFQTNKLDSEINLIKEKEEKNIELEFADAYGNFNEELIFTYNRIEKMDREEEIDRIQEISIEDFTNSFNEQPEVDKEYTTIGSPWPIKVVEKNDTYVKISQEAEVGVEIPQQLFIYEITKVTDEKITLTMQGNDTILPTPAGNLEITFTETEIISTLTPEIGQWIELPNRPEAKVTGLNDTYIFLDANHEFAGKNITVNILLNSRFKEKSTVTGAAVIQGAPTMQIFIMSYCPYGLQMLKGMLPVMEKFQGVANIELRFVGYVMHGEKEEQENYRMICLREEQYSKLIPYLKCFAESGDAESCVAQAGINKAKLDSCISTKAVEYYKEDQALCDKYDIKGSPTTILDGKVTEIWPRSPEDVKKILCEAFSTTPAECSETLNSENPSPGFGGGSSNQGGTC